MYGTAWITEVTRWRDILLDCESDVRKEIADLKHEKELTEAEIEYLNLSFTVVSECLTQRDKRGGSDLCRDPAEEELKRELTVLESLKKMLTDKCQTAWEQTNRLEEIKFQLEQDLSDKAETLNIDHYNLGLDENCANTSYKPHPLRVPKQTLSHDSWLEHCKFLQQRTAHELATSQKLRESMFVPRERARNDLQAQNDATNFALRKRIYETQRIKNELEWQRINVSSLQIRVFNQSIKVLLP
ncbi:hypothetical protein LSTR_LSTR012155 [Laodelphax striatellus]|uniref:Tektin n=1 Tax=Laodelphax striatellus TaxID=195883 RepID=A0A482X369_LAOST|nr:hypothetical protein LSTR_LSTR012155 [Laodelphax striatellus]